MIAVGWAVLFLWPVIAVVVYKNLRLPVALCVTILGGNMLLPGGLGIDLPLLPPLNKYSLTMIVAVLLTALYAGKRPADYPVLPGWIPRNGVAIALLIILFAGVIGSVLANGDTLTYGWRVIQGIRVYDVISETVRLLIVMTPFFLARKVLYSPEGQRVLLTALVISTLVYSIPALYEVRMSPQLHNQIYGFTPWSFVQQMRAGGFRPVVFLSSGLEFAMFTACATIAAAGMVRVVDERARTLWFSAMVWLCIMLVLSKTFGALLLALIFVPAALFLKPRTQLLIVACCAGLVLTYPVLRAANLVPVDRIVAFTASIDPARADSFNTRVYNENQLLAKAQERPVFGWGGWGRSRVYNQFGRDVSLTDGAWVGAIGKGGWFGYVGTFGLLCLPAFGLFFGSGKRIDPVCATLALILGAALIDLVPNSGSPTIYYMVAGALLGRMEMKSSIEEEPQKASGYHMAKPGYARGALIEEERALAPKYARVFHKKDSRTALLTEEIDEPGRASHRRAKAATGYRK